MTEYSEKLKSQITEYIEIWKSKGWHIETMNGLAALALSQAGEEKFKSVDAAFEKLLSILKSSDSEQAVLDSYMLCYSDLLNSKESE